MDIEKSITLGVIDNHGGDSYALFEFPDYPCKKLKVYASEWSEYLAMKEALFDIERDWDKRAERGYVKLEPKTSTYTWETE